MRCIQVCDKIQGMHIWDLMGTGTRTTIGVSGARHVGRLRLHLLRPVHDPLSHGRSAGARTTPSRVFDALANPKKITVVQMAPAVRAAWAEILPPEA